jgi:hypothetical protein
VEYGQKPLSEVFPKKEASEKKEEEPKEAKGKKPEKK